MRPARPRYERAAGEAPVSDHYDARDARDPAERERDLFARLPAVLAAALRAPAYAERLAGIDPAAVTSREALARLPVLRKSELPALQKADPPFGGLVAEPLSAFGRLFTSPGPIFEPEAAKPDPWRGARALHADRVPARRRGAEHLQLPPHPRRLHHGRGGPGAGLRRDPGRARQHGAASSR